MKEIGGYFELELTKRVEYHKNAIKLNTGRNALEYILLAQDIQKIYLPFYICGCVLEPLHKHGINYQFYHVDENFEIIDDLNVQSCEKILYVNYFALKDKYIEVLVERFGVDKLIIDNTQAFYSTPMKGVDTFYSPRKFFGVPGGGYLYSTKILDEILEIDDIQDKLTHLTGRIEKSASDYYASYRNYEKSLNGQNIKQMSIFTKRILESIDYEDIAKKRRNNFEMIHCFLKDQNNLNLDLNSVPFTYPLLIEDGKYLKQKLIEHKIYIPTYWYEVLEQNGANEVEKRLVENIVCIPIDQRLDENDIRYVINIIRQFI